MKNIIKLTFAAISVFALSACSEGYIDDISQVAQGEDKTAPVVEILSPTGNIFIPSTASGANLNFQFKVSDDIEIGNVELFLDGAKLSSYNTFIDYRNLNSSFSYNNLGLGDHTFIVNAKDLTGKTSTKSFTFNIDKYNKLLNSETLYMPFSSGNVFTDLISTNNPTIVGSPTTVSGGHSGSAYKGATDSYLTYPIDNLFGSKELTTSFWYKVDATQERAGIIVVGDPTETNNDDGRKKGFRLFREGGNKTVKLNVGVGTGESWNDGFDLGTTTGWVHIAVTISETESKIYLNGALQRTATLSSPISFANCKNVSIGSGAPTFSYWDHKADTSMIDELRFFNKALTPSEIQTIMQ